MKSFLRLFASAFFIAVIFAAAHGQTVDDKSLNFLTGSEIAGAWRINYSETDDLFSKMQKFVPNKTESSKNGKNADSKEDTLPVMSISLVPPETLIVAGNEKSVTINECFNNVVLTRTFETDGKNRTGEFLSTREIN